MADGAPLFVVAAALVDGAGRVLVQRRPPGKSLAGLWEFPGGKLEPGEAPAEALARELQEELAIEVDPAACAPLAFADAPLGRRRLILMLYRVREWRGDPRAMEGGALAWRAPAALDELPMPPADRPLVAVVQDVLGRPG